MATFPDDHPVAALRGRRIPEPSEIRATMAKRVSWLEHQVRMRTIDGRDPGLLLVELKATVAVMAVYEASCPPEPARDTERPKADGGEVES